MFLCQNLFFLSSNNQQQQKPHKKTTQFENPATGVTHRYWFENPAVGMPVREDGGGGGAGPAGGRDSRLTPRECREMVRVSPFVFPCFPPPPLSLASSFFLSFFLSFSFVLCEGIV